MRIVQISANVFDIVVKFLSNKEAGSLPPCTGFFSPILRSAWPQPCYTLGFPSANSRGILKSFAARRDSILRHFLFLVLTWHLIQRASHSRVVSIFRRPLFQCRQFQRKTHYIAVIELSQYSDSRLASSLSCHFF